MGRKYDELIAILSSLEKEFAMKNLRPILTVLAVLLMATAAQAQQTKVRAVVPFNFIAGDTVYPAGEYALDSVLSGPVIKITDADRDTSAMILSHACENVAPSPETKLVFHRIGGNYFLYQVWTAGNTSGREFTRTKAEVRLAQNHEKPEVLVVAANISK
jgi:hypothetical protein